MKKIISAAMCIALCIGLVLTSGCNGGKSEKENSDIADKTAANDMYVYNEFALNNGNDEIMESYFNGSDLYYVSYVYPEEGEEDRNGKLHQFKTGSGEDVILCDIEDAPDIIGMYVTEQNQIKLLHGEYVNDDSYKAVLVTKMADGTDVSSVSFSDNINASLGEEYDISFARFMRDGQLYVSCESNGGGSSYIVRSDVDGNVTGSVKYDDYIDGIFLDNENKPAIETNSSDGLKYTYIDFDKGCCGETVAIGDNDGEFQFAEDVHADSNASKIYSGSGDVTCYIKDTAGLCAYKAAEQSITFLFDWTGAGIIGSFVFDLLPLENGKVFCKCWNKASEIKYGIVEELKDGKERKVIKCAALSTNEDDRHMLERNIIDYNKSNSDYRVELVSYEKSTSPLDAFAKDVISGNIPDVLDISGVDVKSYISQGFFEDLAPFMEKDAEFGKDYYVDGLYDAIAVDGKQYYAIRGFGFETIAAKASDIEKYKDGWTIHDLIEYYNSKPDGTMLCVEQAKKEIFNLLAAPFIENYIDWDTGKVKFDSDEFRELVTFCNGFPSNYELVEDYNDVSKQIEEGSLLINQVSVVREYEMFDLQFNRELFNGDICYVGCPSPDKKKAIICPASGSLAMMSSSDEKDGAWDFIKSVITAGQDTSRESFDFVIPSGKKQFESYVKKIMATEKYTDETGNVVNPIGGKSSFNDFDFRIMPYSEEEINTIRALIKNSTVKTDNNAVMAIIEPVLNDYFEGRKTVDELISVLQDRVGKYVNENR